MTEDRRPISNSGAYGAFENNGLMLLVSDADDDVSELCIDAEIAPGWPSVCAVMIPSIKGWECAICLDTLVAPVSTKCGHIFCAECIVHHALMFEVSRSRKCPCCLSALEACDLRPLYIRPPHVKDDCFQLMERDRSQRSAWPHGCGHKGLPYVDEIAFCKIFLCDANQAWNCVEPFFSMIKNDAAYAVLDSVCAAYVARHAARQKTKTINTTLDEDKKNRFLFYGAVNGASSFLHPLLLRSLLARAENNPDKLPKFIKLCTTKKKKYCIKPSTERFALCHGARKRLPWIAHLPLGAEIELCWADIQGGGIRVKDTTWDNGEFAKGAFELRPPELINAFKSREERLRCERNMKRKLEKRCSSIKKKQTPPDSKFYDSRILEASFRPRQAFDLSDHDFAPLVRDQREDQNQEEDENEEILSGEKPTFADLVTRGFAAELGFPALGSSPTAITLASSPASKSSPWPALRATTPEHPRRAPAWGSPLTSNSRTPTSSLAKNDIREFDDEDFAPPPQVTSLPLAGLLESALKLEEAASTTTDSSSSTSTKKNKKKKKGGIALSLNGGGRGAYY